MMRANVYDKDIIRKNNQFKAEMSNLRVLLDLATQALNRPVPNPNLKEYALSKVEQLEATIAEEIMNCMDQWHELKSVATRLAEI